jgi:hypothetical protein
MEPITTAIIAALFAGAADGAGGTGKQAVVDAYKGLQELLKQTFGDDSQIVKAVAELEKDPDSPAHQLVLRERMNAVRANRYPELTAAAQALLDQIKAQPGGAQHIQAAFGIYIAQADPGETVTVNGQGRT